MTTQMKRTALVTGASSGIGEQLAQLLARDGHDVILVARNEERLQAKARDMSLAHSVKAYPLPADLVDPDAVAALPGRVERLGLEVDVLVNNAGFNECGSFLETDLGNELGIIQAQAAATVALCKAFVPGMVQRGGGRVMNLGSTGSFIPCPLDAVYCAAKAFVKSFSEALDAELAGSGVSVTTLCPGATRTNFAPAAGIEDSMLFSYGVMRPEAVAKKGVAAMYKGRRVVVAGCHNRLMLAFLPLTPRCVADWIGKALWRTSGRGMAARGGRS
mgnify:CR=1 FL=1